MQTTRMLDLGSEYELFADEIREAIDGVLNRRQFINGPEVRELEEVLSRRVGTAHAIAVSSGTDAILCTLMARGVCAGDEVILPSFTFFASAGCVARLGAIPVFVDIDPKTFNIDPSKIEPAITKNTRAIMAVHIFGQCAEMDAINTIAAKHGLAVIEDAAQAIDATYHGRFAGALGTAACLSFYPTKTLGGFGEGGMIFTSDDALALVARQLRNHGESQRYVHERVGGNFRLDTMKAAILLVKTRYLEQFTRRRRHNAARYDTLLKGLPLTTPFVPAGHEPVYHQYTILCDRRDELQAFLRERGIATGVYYAIGLHLQPCFASLGYQRGSLSVTEATCARVLSLPCHPMLRDEELEAVSSAIQAFYETQAFHETKESISISPGGAQRR